MVKQEATWYGRNGHHEVVIHGSRKGGVESCWQVHCRTSAQAALQLCSRQVCQSFGLCVFSWSVTGKGFCAEHVMVKGGRQVLWACGFHPVELCGCRRVSFQAEYGGVSSYLSSCGRSST